MSKITFDISMSLDGFVTAANRRPDAPMGDGGEVLHDWVAGDDRDREVLESGIASIGAVVAGRRTYDDSVRWWGADGPTGDARLPVFVVTHTVPEQVPENSVYIFVTDGIERALDLARAAAAPKGVCVMGGANIAQQVIRAGLVDEISIHLVPVLLGGGLRLFDALADGPVALKPVNVVGTDRATHLQYRVVSQGAAVAHGSDANTEVARTER
jgi:dihydrofolate reductase